MLPVLLVCASAVVAAPAPFTKPDRCSPLDGLRGEWVVVSEKRHVTLQLDGKLMQGYFTPATIGRTLSVTNGYAHWHNRGEVTSEPVRLDGKSIKLGGGQATRQGLWKREGGALPLRVSHGPDAAPVSFDGRHGDTVIVLRRKK